MIDEYLDRIRAFCKERDWTPTDLAREAKVSEGTLRKMHRRDWAPTTRTIRRIEKVMRRAGESA